MPSASVNSESFNLCVSYFVVGWWHLFSFPWSHGFNVEQTSFVLPIHIILTYLRRTLLTLVLVLGLCFFAGGMRFSEQGFDTGVRVSFTMYDKLM